MKCTIYREGILTIDVIYECDNEQQAVEWWHKNGSQMESNSDLWHAYWLLKQDQTTHTKTILRQGAVGFIPAKKYHLTNSINT